MALIHIDNLQPDMVLAADLRSAQGRLLLPKGTILTAEHLRIFATWGISEAEIADASSEELETGNPLDEIDRKIIDASEAIADSRFSLANCEHPVMRNLSKHFVMRVCRRLAHGGGAVAHREKRVAVEDPAPDGSPHTPSPKLQLNDLEIADSRLASLPDIFMEICETLNNPNSSAAYVAKVISKDMNLSAKLLKLVNSAFYGFPKQIDTLSRAVTILGSQQLITLAVGVSVIKIFDDIPSALVDMKSFWKHSIACGILARLIAAQTDRNLSEERFFVGGLLHDIGRLYMLTNYPRVAHEALVASQQQQTGLVPVESKLWGLNHATIAGELFRIWKFPASLEASVRYHHKPLEAPSPLEPGIIHLADILAHSFDMGESGNWFVPDLEPEIWKMTGLSESSIPFLANRTDQQIANVQQVLRKTDTGLVI